MIEIHFNDELVKAIKRAQEDSVSPHKEGYIIALVLATLNRLQVYSLDNKEQDRQDANIKEFSGEYCRRRKAIENQILDADSRICCSTISRFRN